MRQSSARSRIVVLALYRRREEARLGRHGLRRAGIWRAVVMHKPSETGTNFEKVVSFPRLGGAFGFMLGICLGLLFSLPLGPSMVLTFFSSLGGAFVGERAEAFFFPKYRRLLRRLLPGETAVLAFVRANRVEEAVRILREAGEGVALFFFRPRRLAWRTAEEEPLRREVYNLERLALHAARLATEQGISATSCKARPLLLRLAESARILEEAWRDLGEAARTGQSLAAGAEWFLDNAYLIAGQVLEVQHNLPQSYYAELPLLTTAQGMLPRVYAMAVELVAHTDGRLDRESIVQFLKTYQSVARLTMGELWAMPLALRLALIENLRRLAIRVCRRQHEHEEADFWANRLLQAAHHDPDRVLFVLAELAAEYPEPRPYFALRLLGHVHDEPAALLPLQGWLERKLGAPMAELLPQEQNRQAADQVSIGNTVTSLRFLARLDWKEVFEETNRVEEVLRLDPAGVYGRMDFATRDACRHAVEELARWSRWDEEEVAREAVAIARRAVDPRRKHVGHYLIGKGRREFQKILGCRVPFGVLLSQWLADHPEAVYFGSLGLFTSAVFLSAARFLWGGGGRLLARLSAVFCLLLVASEIGLQLQTRLLTRLFPPRALPRLDLEKGIPDEFRTLVIVPMMLLTPEAVRDEVHRLEVRFLANQDPNLFYGLVADFADAPAPRMPEDEHLLRIAREGIARLNERYGRRFFLFYRERRWNPAEGRFIGWERKRGKIEELNRFLLALAEGKEETGDLICFGPQEFLAGVRFVITLDADTQLPRDTARKLVATMAHPENQPELTPDGRRVREGYTIIQPLVRTSLPAATVTCFTRLFSDPTGTDPYCHTVSDVYQDLFGAGTFYSKGLYDLLAFHRVLGGRFPENTVLSHDLLEGAYVRVGFASDIVLLDLFPLSYQAYSRRQHRWIRGDWQLVPWLWPRVPKAGGEKEPNPLSPVDRWKIADNLRRSLVPSAAFILLVLAWAFGLAPAVSGLFVGLVFFLPALFQLPWRGDAE
ncbi:MAG: glycosyl transferase, partial [Firmicutes bacterium]|nr:glycosyl transferase [Bacillota bacterium]